MKKLFFFFAALAVAFAFTSCSSSDEGNNGGDGPGDEAGQKEYLEQTATILMDKVKADDFKPITNLVDYVNSSLTRATSNKTEAIDNFFEAAIKACTLSETSTYVKRLYVASNFAAEFTYQNGAWVKTGNGGGNTLRFIFNDRSGQSCLAEITAEGNTQQVHADFFDAEEHEWYWNSNDYGYTTKTIENQLGVPERVTARLTQGSTVLADVQVNSKVTTGEFQPQSGTVSVSVVANIVGYNITVDKAYYNGGRDCGVNSVSISKNGEMLVSASASANVSVNSKGEVTSAGAGQCAADVLGRVQLKGSASNMKQLVELINQAAESESEDECKNYANQINQQLNVGLYYNGSNTRQSYLQMYPIKESYTSYYGGTEEWWHLEPVVCFADGSSYSTLSEFFNDDKFRDLEKRFESLVRDFEGLVK